MLHTLVCALAATLATHPSDDDSTTEPSTPFLEVAFAAADGLEITADLYRPSRPAGERAAPSSGDERSTPFIVLCHQAGSSRGEYRSIAPRLNDLGFHCLAIDQRSGAEIAGVPNETARRAEAAGQRPTYVDAEQDVLAALRFARESYGAGPLLVLGSSYSSALALRIAGEHAGIVDGVLAFAPGEYFLRLGKPEGWIASSAAKVAVPCFIASAKHEHQRWRAIFAALPDDSKVFFLPESEGEHGARALWPNSDASEAYWRATASFLERFGVAEEPVERAARLGG
ncbi:MAG: alpha/beta fold hydrolase [Planctomycetota bacterium]